MKDLSHQFPSFLHGNGYLVSFMTKWTLCGFGKSPLVVIRGPYCFTVYTMECLVHKFTSHAIIAGYVDRISFAQGGFGKATRVSGA